MSCEDCPVRVGGRGDIAASFVIVGEAPGQTEIDRGKAFVGPSGRLLTDTLRRYGIDPLDCWYTNALQCPVTSPSLGQIDKCRDRLREELAYRERKLILLLGNSAIYSVIQKPMRVTYVRGSVIESEYGPTINTLHPAAILRSPNEYRTFCRDIEETSRLLSGGVRKSVGETYYRVVKREEISRAIAGLSRMSRLACDIETAGSGKGLNWQTDRILALGICWEPGKVLIFRSVDIPLLAPLFSNRNIVFIWHNGQFDTSFLQQMGIEARIDLDTELYHYALEERRGTHGLKRLASDYLGAPTYIDEIKPYLGKNRDYSAIPAKVLNTYLARDCDYTYQLHERLEAEEDLTGDRLYHRLLLPASRMLQRVQRRGILVDKVALEAIGVQCDELKAKSLGEMREILREAIGDQSLTGWGVKKQFTATTFNPSSPVQVKRVIYDVLRMRPDKDKAIRFNFTTRADELELLPEYPFLTLLQQYRAAIKIKGTYVTGFLRRIGPDGRIHTTYKVHGSTTGRLSSGDPNVQNIPRTSKKDSDDPIGRIKAHVKDVFIASPGTVMIEFDYSQAELRVLALLSGDPLMVDMFRNNRDMHSEVAEMNYGKGFTPAQRDITKNVNFSSIYGVGISTLMKKYKITAEQAQWSLDRWREIFHVAYRWITAQREKVSSGEILCSRFGRRRHWGLVNRDNLNSLENEAANHEIQGTASDLTLISALQAEKWLNDNGISIINLVHDAIYVECPPDKVESCVSYMLELMSRIPRELLGDLVPFVADAKVGSSMSDMRKVKAA